MENQEPTQESLPESALPKEPAVPMIAVPLRIVMLSYNHIIYSIKAGSYKDLTIEELKAVIDNAAALKVLIPEQLRKQVE